ncbi:flagellin N-terminal helical domain-containing protein [Proteocatella sphenisci]|uniref:flagellin N-terminal helical domain-containing protein n=1 Tax=Proteocatella sphenisci TaxID=181070 RepID=UPI00048AC186|nr:hypothetical protein [Proteocatella sphenisci]
MRISTNSIIRNYRTNLGKSTSRLNESREKVLTERKFNRASQDPAAANKAFQLRREYLKNEDYLHNLGVAQGQLAATESSLMQVNEMSKQAKGDILRALNGATSKEGRTAIAQNLEETAESIVMSMNARYGDKFLFGGASTKEAPFKLEAGDLFYRGISVTNGDLIKLKEMSEETNYIDLGFGLSKDEVSGEIIKGTAYNLSNPGIEALGYGVDGEINKNLVVQLMDMAKVLRADDFDSEKLGNMSTQFDKSVSNNLDKITQLGSTSKFLEDTESRLKDNNLNLNEKIISVENVDLAQAITEFSWAEYAYNAALKVGNSILSQSFIDFMR